MRRSVSHLRPRARNDPHRQSECAGSRHGSSAEWAESGCEQLGVEPFAELAALSALRLDESVPEQRPKLFRGPLEQTLGRPGSGLDLEPDLGRTDRELQLVPGQIQPVESVLVAVLRAAVP